MKKFVIIFFLLGASLSISAECPCEKKARKKALEDNISSTEKNYQDEPNQETLKILAALYEELENFDET